MHTFLGQKTVQEEYDDHDHAIAEKLSALYGNEWSNKSSEELMDDKYFEEIPEFLCSKKTLTCGSVSKRKLHREHSCLIDGEDVMDS